MSEQISMFILDDMNETIKRAMADDEDEIIKQSMAKAEYEVKKLKWENAFQRWSNKQAQDERTAIGICGFGVICDWCDDNTYGRPCVRALNAMCREKRISIDYNNQNFEEMWSGRP